MRRHLPQGGASRINPNKGEVRRLWTRKELKQEEPIICSIDDDEEKPPDRD